MAEDRDARTSADLADCRFAESGHDDIGDRCAAIAHEVTLGRLDQAVPPLSAATAAHIREIAERGRELGRRRDGLALVGDSITASPKFLRPFAGELGLPAAVDAALRLEGGEQVTARFRDAFSGSRAAKIGAHSWWALDGGTGSPLSLSIAERSPSVAVVMYGSNDATRRFTPLDELVGDYRRRMGAIVDVLEAAGVVAILNTVPRHMHDPSRRDCDTGPGDMSNWRLAVQTSALSAAVAELACERNLPLIDLRHALDATLNSGIGPDGVHPHAHPRSAGDLSPEGLRCGYNVRNYVTLRMLARVVDAMAPSP